MDLLAAPEWHYWIAVLLTPAAILSVPAVIGGYIYKVVRPQYPPRQKKQGAGR